MDQKVMAYFSSINPIARKIIQDEETVKSLCGGDWNDMDYQKQEEVLDDFMVPPSVREKYATCEKTLSYPSSFPKMIIQSGEKIVVDCDNDYWTWQDEHSSPFSWKTKSQQDLTLLDLEPDQLQKPSPAKSKKSRAPSDQSNDQSPPTREFAVKTDKSIWDSPFLAGMKKPTSFPKPWTESPTHSVTSGSLVNKSSRDQSPEAINYAFTGSTEELVGNVSERPIKKPDSLSLSSKSTYSLGQKSGKTPQKSPSKSPVKSPLHPKLPTPSVSKTPKEESGVALVGYKRRGSKDNRLGSDSRSEENAFDNPAMAEGEWSNFVGEETDGSLSSSTASPSHRPLLREPQQMKMERGEGRTDQALLSEDQTRLLEDSAFQSVDLTVNVADVVRRVDSVSMDSGSPTALSDSTPKSGFAFLDNW